MMLIYLSNSSKVEHQSYHHFLQFSIFRGRGKAIEAVQFVIYTPGTDGSVKYKIVLLLPAYN